MSIGLNSQPVLILVTGSSSQEFVEVSNSLIKELHQEVLIRFEKYEPLDFKKADLIVCLDSHEFLYDGPNPLNRVNPWGTAILNLEDLELCRRSNETSLKIQWFSGRDPRKLLGQLLDHYEGAYQDSIFERIVYQTCRDIEYYAEQTSLSKVSGWKSETIALVCALSAAGANKVVIKDLLEKRTQTKKTIIREVEL